MGLLASMTFDVEFSKDHPATGERALWFYMTFSAGEQVRAVETSDTMWDIGSLLDWLECIVSGRDECRLDVDREGEIDTLFTIPVDAQSVRLVIQDDLDDEEVIVYLDAVVDRRVLVEKTYVGILQFIKSSGLVGRGYWTYENGKPVYYETDDLSDLNSEEVEAWINVGR